MAIFIVANDLSCDMSQISAWAYVQSDQILY